MYSDYLYTIDTFQPLNVIYLYRKYQLTMILHYVNVTLFHDFLLVI